MSALNIALSTLRDQGVVANLLLEFVPPPASPPDIDLGISQTQATVMEASTGSAFGVFLFVVAIMWTGHWDWKRRHKHTVNGRPSSMRNLSPEELELEVFYGENPCLTVVFDHVDGEYIPVRCSAFGSHGPPMSCDPPVECAEHLKYLLHLCEKVDHTELAATEQAEAVEEKPAENNAN